MHEAVIESLLLSSEPYSLTVFMFAAEWLCFTLPAAGHNFGALNACVPHAHDLCCCLPSMASSLGWWSC